MRNDPKLKAIEAMADEAFDKLWAEMQGAPELEELCRGFFLRGYAAGGEHGSRLLGRSITHDLIRLLNE